MADLRLADTVDTAKALFQPVGIPRQVVVDHEVGVLQVDAFPGGICGDQHPRGRVIAEQFLDLPTLLTFDAAVDGDNGLRVAEQSADLLLEIVQRVAVLGEDDQLALAPDASRISGVFCSSVESSSHLRSWPEWTTCLACSSRPCSTLISASSS